MENKIAFLTNSMHKCSTWPSSAACSVREQMRPAWPSGAVRCGTFGVGQVLLLLRLCMGPQPCLYVQTKLDYNLRRGTHSMYLDSVYTWSLSPYLSLYSHICVSYS